EVDVGEPDILFGFTDLRRLAEPFFRDLLRPGHDALLFVEVVGFARDPDAASKQPVELNLPFVLRPDELPGLLPPPLRPILLGVALEEHLLVPVPQFLALAVLFSTPELLFHPLPFGRFFRPRYQRAEVERFLFRTLLERGQVGRVVLRPLFFVRPGELLFLPVLELFVQVRRR
ncbi:MAG TPA: hypothetical protein VMY15_07955, partial [Candidatus Latescibacteria bacterium]|nr:hypothetical protein [Candidatus Latescibacterota bacterium]